MPGLLALVFGWFAFRSRVTGVYLSIITQAMTFALLLAFFRNDMGFGGNNGLTDFKTFGVLCAVADHPRRAVRTLSAGRDPWLSGDALHHHLQGGEGDYRGA